MLHGVFASFVIFSLFYEYILMGYKNIWCCMSHLSSLYLLWGVYLTIHMAQFLFRGLCHCFYVILYLMLVVTRDLFTVTDSYLNF